MRRDGDLRRLLRKETLSFTVVHGKLSTAEAAEICAEDRKKASNTQRTRKREPAKNAKMITAPSPR